MTTAQKILLAVLLFTAWGVLVAAGMTPAGEFVAALRDALIALGVFQATITYPKE